MTRYFFFLLLTIAGDRCPAQHDVYKWLSDHRIPLRTLDPDSADFSDLEFVRKSIGNARVVLLAEPTHGVGTCFEAKTRIIRMLHEQMGFNTLAFESGMYDCWKSWQQYTHHQITLDSAFRQAVFSVWSGVEELQPLIEYMDAEARTGSPLELAGIDCQHMPGMLQAYYQDVKQYYRQFADDTPVRDSLRFMNWARYFDGDGPERLRKEEPARVFDFRREYKSSLHGRSDSMPLPDFDLSIQMEMFAHAQSNMIPALANRDLRDRAMFDNLIYLLQTSGKVIVWLHAGHADRQENEITRFHRIRSVFRYETLGNHLAQSTLARETFVLGFSAFEGEARHYDYTPAFLLRPSRPRSIEYSVTHGGLHHGYIDLRLMRHSQEFRGAKWKARLDGLRNRRRNWHHRYDAVIVIRRMKPSTKR